MTPSDGFNQWPIMEDPRTVCEALGISQEAFHSIQLQLRGISASKELYGLNASNIKEIHLLLPNNERRGQYSVPKKVPLVPMGTSPYRYADSEVYFNGRPLFIRHPVVRVPLPEPGTPRYFKGYSFPFFGTSSPYRELRINPRNTGQCPGRCLFCHRTHSFDSLRSSSRIFSPKEILDRIVSTHGTDVFSRVSQISVITELFGSEKKYLSYLEELKRDLFSVGFPRTILFSACSQDVRSLKGMQRLRSITSVMHYSYTLEVFHERHRIMGSYKGVSMEKAESILMRARQAGFEQIKINYVAGIDPLAEFEEGFRRLHLRGLIDSIGLSIFTAFLPKQFKLRHPDAWHTDYYVRVIDLLKALGIAFYKPSFYEMGYPLELLQLSPFLCPTEV